MRDALGDAVVELGSELPNLIVIGADTSESLQTMRFGKQFPDRFFNVGIAEQNMVGISAGFALSGMRVICGTYQVFLERAIDQIRNTIAYCNLDVKIVGAHTGLATGPDGGSHQAIEDISIMRAIPNIKVVAPCDYTSCKELVRQATLAEGPFYIRIIRPALAQVYDDGKKVRLGKANVLKNGSDVTIIAHGIMVQEAIKAAALLEADGVSAAVVDCHTIKPIDGEMLLQAAESTRAIVVAEDHNIIGGLGSAVAEFISENSPVEVGIVGVKDTFGESGDQASLFEKYGLTAASIQAKAKYILGKEKTLL